MNSNFHTHTYLCNHAVGSPREYVEKAIQNGLKKLGFSDHSPYIFGDMPYYSNFRMKKEETEKYIKEITDLRDEYKNDIKIYVGYEMEYYPKHFYETLEFLKQYPCDYLLLGQHFIGNEYDGIYVGSATSDGAVLTRYADQLIDAMETGKFTYLAHPDVINCQSDAKHYRTEMTRICEAAKRLNVPLELNLLGFEEKRHYPYNGFWRLAAEIGNDVVIGCDAHKAEAVGNKQVEKEAIEYLNKFNIVTVKEAEPIKP